MSASATVDDHNALQEAYRVLFEALLDPEKKDIAQRNKIVGPVIDKLGDKGFSTLVSVVKAAPTGSHCWPRQEIDK